MNARSKPQAGPSGHGHRGSHCPADVKVEVVLRLLGGESLTDLSRETGRPPKQLSAWRNRFLAGGEAALEGRTKAGEIEALRAAQRELSERVADLNLENRRLSRQLELVDGRRPSRAVQHPFCSKLYGLALEEPGIRSMYVPEWGTCVLVQETTAGTFLAAGVRPIASLYPDCDLRAGLHTLRREGIMSVSLVTDPMCCPELPMLRQSFQICRPFKTAYYIDREAQPVHVRKRHRNIVNRARQAVEIREILLSEQLQRWLELYQSNVENRQIGRPFTASYYERISELEGLRAVAVLVNDEIVTMTLWLRHDDILYFHESASSETGFSNSATYAAFAYVIENATDLRYIYLGTGTHFGNTPSDGLAIFKRGFANASAVSYICRATTTA